MIRDFVFDESGVETLEWLILTALAAGLITIALKLIPAYEKAGENTIEAIDDLARG